MGVDFRLNSRGHQLVMLPVAGAHSNVFPQLHSQPLRLTDLLLHEGFENNSPTVPVGPSPWGESLKGTLWGELEFQSLWLATRPQVVLSVMLLHLPCKPPASSCVISRGVGGLSCAHVRARSLQLYPTLCDRMDCSPPGSSVHGIFQARILEWVAMPPPGDFRNPGIKLASLMSLALARGFFRTSAT